MSSANKVWYIKFGQKAEGPYTVAEVLDDLRVDYDTLVWQEGFDRWKALREVPELVSAWRERDQELKDPRGKESKLKARITPDGLVIDARRPPPSQLLWALLAAAIAAYVVLKMIF